MGTSATGVLTARVAALLLAAAACGTVANLVSPRRIPWVEDWAHYIEARALREGIALVTPGRAWDLLAAGTHVFFDARPAADYEAGHIPTAVSVPYDGVEEAMPRVQMLLTPAQPIVTYCSGRECDESFLLTLYLREQGFTNVVLFAGGFERWRAAGHPVEGGP